jgi:hypothetical protein
MGLDLRDEVAFLHLGFFIASGMVCQGQTVRQGVHKVMGGLEFVTAATRTFGAREFHARIGRGCSLFRLSVFGFCVLSPLGLSFVFLLSFCSVLSMREPCFFMGGQALTYESYTQPARSLYSGFSFLFAFLRNGQGGGGRISHAPNSLSHAHTRAYTQKGDGTRRESNADAHSLGYIPVP